jgi:hypothetical protein
MHPRWAVALALTSGSLFVAPYAYAWQEAHEVGDDARVRVDANGMADVEHLVRWRIVHGPIKTIDLGNVDPAATLDPTVSIATDDGHGTTGHAARQGDSGIRVVVEDPRALVRGTFTIDLRWHTDLVATGAAVRDGTSLRLTLASPGASDGFDAARVVLDLPAAPGAPEAIVADTGAIDDSVLTTLRRGPTRDELELVRPHVGRGELVASTVRVDPRALSFGVPAGASPGMADRPPMKEPNRIREVLLASGFGVIATLFALLVAAKSRAAAKAGERKGARVVGVLPLPTGLRAAVAGLALASAVGLQIGGESAAGAYFAVLATLAAGLRPPRAARAVRGPGRWLALRSADAFAEEPARRDWFDIDTGAGRAAALFAGLAVLAVAWATKHAVPESFWLAAIDGAALVPLFITGRASQIGPEAGRGGQRWLARAFSQLRRIEELRTTPWGRLTLGGAVDELRLRVAPRSAVSGFVGIEIGLAWRRTTVGWVCAPEILARVLRDGEGAARLAERAPTACAVPGRRADERVVRFVPRAPTCDATVTLAHELAQVFTHRPTGRAPCPVQGRVRAKPTSARGTVLT